MKEDLRKLITTLTGMIGVSGYEWEVANYIAKELKPYADEIQLRPNGNLIVTVKGEKPGPKVLYGAHMDEVGYVIKSIDEDGFLYFGKVGGSSENILPGRKVLIQTEKELIPGVIGTRSTHMLTEDEAKKMQSVKTSYVDICAESKKQAMEWGVTTGCQMVIESPCTALANPDYMTGKAADCRALCAILTDAVKRIDKSELCGTHYFVFTAMEEVTTAGIKAAVTYLSPDYCYIFDTVPCGDVPDIRPIDNPLKLGGGAALMLAQHNSRYTNYAIAHPKLLAAARQAAKENEIPVQEFAFVGAFYSNDGAGAINAGIGNAVLSIALTRRYSHSPTEVFCLNDCVAIEKLVLALAKKPVDVNMLAE